MDKCKCVHFLHGSSGCRNETHMHDFCGPCQSEGPVRARLSREVVTEETSAFFDQHRECAVSMHRTNLYLRIECEKHKQ